MKLLEKMIRIEPKRLILIVACALLLFQGATQLYFAHADSQTTDEGVHLSAGYTYLTQHDFRFNPEHPPLLKMWAALPLLIIKPHEPTDQTLWDRAGNFFYDSWHENRAFGEQLLYSSGNNADQLLFFARAPMVLLTVLLGLVIFLLTRKLFGDAPAIVTLTAYVFDPTVTAHGHLVTTDIGVSLGFILTLWALWHFLQTHTWSSVLWFGIALGLTLGAKYTSVIIIPIILIWIGFEGWTKHWSFPVWLKFIGKLIVAGLLAWFIIFSLYGWNTTPAPNTDSLGQSIVAANIPGQSNALASSTAASDAHSLYSKLRLIMIPRDYFKGLAMVLGHVGNGQDAFLFGHTSKTGWWYYFPVVFLIKTPLTSLALLCMGAFVAIKNRSKNKFAYLMFISACVYLAFAMTSKANLGVRHVMPMITIFTVFTGAAYTGSLLQRRIAAALLLLTVLTWFMAYPYFLGFFNQTVGGSSKGYLAASDSNLDWGQDIKRIKTYLDTHPTSTPPYIVYQWDSEAALDYYGLTRRPYNQIEMDKHGLLIIGGSSLSSKDFQWLKRYALVDHITPSVFVYNLDQPHE